MVRSLKIVLYLVLFGWTTVHAQPVKDVSIKWSIPQLSGFPVEGSGTGFLLSRKERLVVTAYHVIPNVIESMGKGMLKVNGVAATLKCYWKEADVALLTLEGDLPDIPELPLELKPAVGMQYESGMTSDRLLTIAMSHDALDRTMSLGGSLRSYGAVMAISEAMEDLPDGSKKGTGAVYLVTDTAAKEGFSGGPAITKGRVIGIHHGITHVGSYGALSSSVNIVKLRAQSTCK